MVLYIELGIGLLFVEYIWYHVITSRTHVLLKTRGLNKLRKDDLSLLRNIRSIKKDGIDYFQNNHIYIQNGEELTSNNSQASELQYKRKKINEK